MTQVPGGTAAVNGAVTKRKNSTANIKGNTSNAEESGSFNTMQTGENGRATPSVTYPLQSRRASQQQHSIQMTSMSPMIISVDKSPSVAGERQQKQQKNAPARNVFQQRNDDVDSQAMPLPIQGVNGNSRSNRQPSASYVGSSVSMVLPTNNNGGHHNSNNGEAKKLIQVDLLNKVDLTAVGGHKPVIREDAAYMPSQRNINNKSAIGANSGYVVADVADVPMAIAKPTQTNRGIVKSEVTVNNSKNFANANNRGMTLGVATLTDTGAVFARVATVAGIDGLAHFEKDDYERFVEDRQRAILFGTLPNKLEDAIVNAAFSAFIGKLKQLELSQKTVSYKQSLNNSTAANAALAVQHRLEAIDDEDGDFVVYLNDHSHNVNLQQQQPVGRQAGGQNQQQMMKRISRPQTRGTSQQGQKGQPGSSAKHQNNLLISSKQAGSSISTNNKSSMLASGTTILTGQGIGQVVQRGQGSTPHSNNTNGRNSTLPQQPMQPSQQQQTANVTYKKIGNGNAFHSNSSMAPSGSVFPFPPPPPSNVIYNMSRKDYASSKLSLPVISATGTAGANKVPPQQLKIVNVNFHENRQLKVDNVSSFSAASSNH